MVDTGMYVDVKSGQNGHVYRIYVEDLGYRIPIERKKRSYVESIAVDKCPDCNKLMVNNVCMNPNCSHSVKV